MTEEDRKSQALSVQYWLESARRDRESAEGMLKLKHFDWSLFIYHLALEKMLKALVMHAGNIPPPTHHLHRLAELAGLRLTEEQLDWFTEITSFNIEARYDDVKQSFYRKATEEYARTWHQRCSALFQWIEEALH